MNKKLDYLINLVEKRVIKEEENKGIFVAPTTQILNSSNTSIYLDPEYYYDVSIVCLLYTSPSPRDRQKSRMPSSA